MQFTDLRVLLIQNTTANHAITYIIQSYSTNAVIAVTEKNQFMIVNLPTLSTSTTPSTILQPLHSPVPRLSPTYIVSY